jgi:uncharacterized protein (UPF0218 family)
MSNEMKINPLWVRLTEQIQNKSGISYDDAKSMAKSILIKRNHIYSDGNLTYDGILRSNMGPEERAVDRAIKRFGGNKNDYVYDSKKNYAYKRKNWNKKSLTHVNDRQGISA